MQKLTALPPVSRSSPLPAQHAALGLQTTVHVLESYYAAFPPTTTVSANGFATISAMRSLLNRGHKALLNVQCPDGQWPANGDNSREGFTLQADQATSAICCGLVLDGEYVPAARSNGSSLMAAYGHVALRSDAGSDAPQLNFEFTKSGNHHHTPPAVLSIQLTAFGRPLLDHNRYQRTRLRNRNGATGAWNTVAINMQNQWPLNVDGSVRQNLGAVHPPVAPREGITGVPYPNPGLGNWMGKGGDANLFIDDPITGVAAVEADGYRAYYPWTPPGGYQRQLVHLSRDGTHALTLDLFRAVGGSTHEYNLHGSTMMAMRARACNHSSTSAGARTNDSTPLLAPGLSWSTPPYTFGFSSTDARWYARLSHAPCACCPARQFLPPAPPACATCLYQPMLCTPTRLCNWQVRPVP